MTSVARLRPSDQRVAAAVDVVELRLGHRVVDVDRREQQRPLLHPLVEAVRRRWWSPRRRRACREARRSSGPARRAASRRAAVRGSRPTPRGRWSASKAGTAPALLELQPLVHQQGGVAAVVDDQRRARRRRATPAPGRCTTSTRRGVSPFQAKTGVPRGSAGVPPVSGRPTTTAAAAWSWVEKMLHDTQRTSAPSAASVSISTAVCTVMCSEPMMRAPASGCVARVLGAQRHQAGHLVLGQADLLAPELGQRQVGDLERLAPGLAGGGRRGGSRRGWCHQRSPLRLSTARSGEQGRSLGFRIGGQRRTPRRRRSRPRRSQPRAARREKPSQTWPICCRYSLAVVAAACRRRAGGRRAPGRAPPRRAPPAGRRRGGGRGRAARRRARRRRSAAPRGCRGAARRCRARPAGGARGGEHLRRRVDGDHAADEGRQRPASLTGAAAEVADAQSAASRPSRGTQVGPAPNSSAAGRSHSPAVEEKNSCDGCDGRRARCAGGRGPGAPPAGGGSVAHQLPEPPRRGVEAVDRASGSAAGAVARGSATQPSSASSLRWRLTVDCGSWRRCTAPPPSARAPRAAAAAAARGVGEDPHAVEDLLAGGGVRLYRSVHPDGLLHRSTSLSRAGPNRPWPVARSAVGGRRAGLPRPRAGRPRSSTPWDAPPPRVPPPREPPDGPVPPQPGSSAKSWSRMRWVSPHTS